VSVGVEKQIAAGLGILPVRAVPRQILHLLHLIRLLLIHLLAIILIRHPVMVETVGPATQRVLARAVLAVGLALVRVQVGMVLVGLLARPMLRRRIQTLVIRIIHPGMVMALRLSQKNRMKMVPVQMGITSKVLFVYRTLNLLILMVIALLDL